MGEQATLKPEFNVVALCDCDGKVVTKLDTGKSNTRNLLSLCPLFAPLLSHLLSDQISRISRPSLLSF